MKNKLDQHIDQTLKTAFDGRLEKAPEGLWDAIADKLDVPAIDQQLDQKLEQSYEQLNQTQAPSMLWGAINEQLDVPADSDMQLDSKLKDSYAAQNTNKAPSKVWSEINRQLNIDTTWNKIDKELNKYPVVNDWRPKMLQFFAAASLMLLLLRTCTDYPVNHTTPIVEQVQFKSATADNNHLQANKRPTKKPKVSKTESLASDHTDNTFVEAERRTNSTTSASENLNQIPKKLSDTEKKDSKITLFQTTDEALNKNTENQYDSENKKKDVLPNAEAANSQVAVFADASETAVTDKQVEADIRAVQLSTNALDAIRATLAVPNLNTEPVQGVESLSLSNQAPFGGKFRAGAFMVMNATMLLNNDTREGFDEASLVQNYYGMAANYGVWMSYKLHEKGALVSEFSINADNRQAYGVYERGNYYIKEWVMKYNRFSLAYQQDLLATNSTKIVQTKLIAQTGVYLGFLREAKLFYDGDLRFDGTQEHHQLDFGFKLSLGQEINIDRFVIGYGIRSDFGVVNIFKGNSNLNPSDNNTNIIHLGGYLSVGYCF